MYFLQKIWERWKIIAHRIGVFQSRLILTLFYFILLFPIGIVFTYFKDILGLKNIQTSTWKKKNRQAETMEEMREQF